jgi:hypothetical protein
VGADWANAETARRKKETGSIRIDESILRFHFKLMSADKYGEVEILF